MGDRTVSVTLRLQVAQYTAGLRDAASQTKAFVGEVDGLGKKAPGRFNDIAMAAAGLGAVLLGVAGGVVKLAAEFDKQMSEVAAVSGATGKQLTQLREAAIQAGKATQYSATEAAKAEAELAKAGLTTSQILGGALNGSLALAAAGQMDLADAATITATTLNMFQLSGSQAGHVADLLASAANTSAADMNGLGLGLKQVGLVAHQAGWSLEQTTGVLAAFADRGLSGSDGATSLKVAIQRLMAPTNKAASLMQQLGIHTYDANGNMVDAAAFAGQLQTTLGGLGAAERNAAMYTLFGSDAIRAAAILYQLGADGVDKYTQNVNRTGAAADTARKKTDNLVGDIERLRGSVETFAIQSGSGANSGLRVLTQSVGSLVDGFSAMPGPVQSALTVIAGVAGAGLLASAGLLKARQAAREALDALREMGPMGSRAADGLGAVAKWGTRVAVILAALQTASAVMGKDINPAIATTSKELDKFAASGERTGVALSHLDYDLKSLSSSGYDQFGNSVAGTIEGLTGVGNLMDESLMHAKERLVAIDQTLAAMVADGHADQAAAAFDRLHQAAMAQGISFDDLKAGLPQYIGALDQSGQAADKAAASTRDAAAALDTTTGSMQAAIDHGMTLAGVFKQLNGAALDWAHAQDALFASFDAATKALKENGRTLDVHTEKGRANRAALEGIAEATAAAMQKRFEDTQSLDEAGKVYEQGRQAFVKAAMAMGQTKAAAEALANQWLRMPPVVTTQVQVLGVEGAKEKVSSVSSALDKLNGRVVTTYIVTDTVTGATRSVRHPGAQFQRWGGITEHAQTGLLREARTFTPMGPARYAFAEPATGGEAFVPRHGDYGRSMAILNRAAGWYGASISTGRGGTSVTNVTVTVNAGMGTDGPEVGRRIADALRPYIRTAGGGSVQTALGKPGS